MNACTEIVITSLTSCLRPSSSDEDEEEPSPDIPVPAFTKASTTAMTTSPSTTHAEAGVAQTEKAAPETIPADQFEIVHRPSTGPSSTSSTTHVSPELAAPEPATVP